MQSCRFLAFGISSELLNPKHLKNTVWCMACCTKFRNSKLKCCSTNSNCCNSCKCEFRELRCGEQSCRQKCSKWSLKRCYNRTFGKCSDKHFIVCFILAAGLLIAAGTIYLVGNYFFYDDSEVTEEQLEECSVSNPPANADCCSTDDPLPIYLSIAGWCMLGAGLVGTGIVGL